MEEKIENKKDLFTRDGYNYIDGLTKRGVKLLIITPIVGLFVIITLFASFKTVVKSSVSSIYFMQSHTLTMARIVP